MLVALTLIRFAHFAAVCLLFGLSAFPFTAGRGVDRRYRLNASLLACAVLAAITGAGGLLIAVGNMADSWRAAFDPDMITAAVTDTGFGRVWLWRLALAVITAALCLRRYPGRDPILLVASGLLLLSIALTGHAPIPDGFTGRIHQLADAVHLLAAGWWTGGLLALLLVGDTGTEEMISVLQRFSRIGYGAVALLTASGLVNGLFLVSPIAAILSTTYGIILLIKVGLFGAMLLLALSNRYQITPALATYAEPARGRKRLMAQVAAEFSMALLVLALVGALGAISPPVSQ